MEDLNEPRELKLHIITRDYELPIEVYDKMNDALQTLRKATADFPVAELHVDIAWLARINEYHVRTSLRLPKRTLATGQRERLLHLAYERCIHKLLNKLGRYKDIMKGKPGYARAAEHMRKDMLPTAQPDLEAMERAVTDRDYVAFRRVIAVFDDALTARVGRWIQRFPRLDAKLGAGLAISELAEAVYIYAFEDFEKRPAEPLGDWLETLINPAIRALAADPEGVKQNLSFIQSAKGLSG